MDFLALFCCLKAVFPAKPSTPPYFRLIRSECMKSFRLNRLFNPVSKRCIDVAVDHGFFNELNFLAGIEDLAKAVDVLVEANPDAIQLTVGQAELLQRIPGKSKPALVLRTDVANVYSKELPRTLFS